MVYAENLKTVMHRELSEIEKKSLMSDLYILYEYVQGQNSRIKQCFEYARLPLEDTMQYQDLVVELARDRAEVVANTVLNWLPFAVRYASPASDIILNNMDNTEWETKHKKKLSFVDMVSKRPRFESDEELKKRV